MARLRAAGPAPTTAADGSAHRASRLGCDLQPVDVHDLDAVDWLRVLIWPEHLDRRAAICCSIGRPVRLKQMRADAAPAWLNAR